MIIYGVLGVAAFLICWFACGLYGVGKCYAYFERNYGHDARNIAQAWEWVVTGPLSVAYLTLGFKDYGWLLPPLPWEKR